MTTTTSVSGTNPAATQPSESTYVTQRQQRINWLLSNGLPPLPVAPYQDPYKYHKVVKASNTRGEHCPLTQDLTPIPLFTGKNPSFLDANGIPHLINHHVYQSRMPCKKEIKRWFKHPDNGIGTLGSDRLKWIDIDAKQFSSQTECDRLFNEILELRPELKLTLLEKTQSGGYRIGVRVKQPVNFTNFCLSPNGPHVGECLGNGRFTVLSPTIGLSGKPYQSLNCSEKLLEIEEIDFIYPTKAKASTETQTTGQGDKGDIGDKEVFVGEKTPLSSPFPVSSPSTLSPLSPEGTIPLELLGHDDSRRVLNGEDLKNDRSDSLTTAISEWAGWVNWCHENRVTISGNVETLAHYAGEKLGIDGGAAAHAKRDRVNRILATIDLEQCHPAAHYRGGDES